MANETLHGQSGSCIVPAGFNIPLNTHIFEWHSDVIQDIHDDSNFDNQTNWRDKIGGMAHIVGTFRATAPRTTAVSLGNAGNLLGTLPTADLELVEEVEGTGLLYRHKFAALIGSWKTDVVKTDRVFYSASFESSGTPVAS